MSRQQATAKRLHRTPPMQVVTAAVTQEHPTCEFEAFDYTKCGAPAKFVLKATRTTKRNLCAQHARKYLNRRPQDVMPVQ